MDVRTKRIGKDRAMNARTTTSTIVASLTLLAQSVAWSLDGPLRSLPAIGIIDLYREGRALYKDKEFEDALDVFGRARFLKPDDRSIRRAHEDAKRKVALSRIEHAREFLAEGDKGNAAICLASSYRIHPTKKAASTLVKLGYRKYLGRWLSRAEIVAFRENEQSHEKASRDRLNLGPEYRVLRTTHFRVFTNLPSTRAWNSWMARSLNVMESTRSEFSGVLEVEVSDERPEPTLDVVFFRNEDSYKIYLSENELGFSIKTAGFYGVRQRASFFYRTPSYAILRSALIHELTHQLCDETLIAACPPWVREGLAQYFEAALVDQHNGWIVGRPHHRRLSYLKLKGLKDGNYIPAEVLFKARTIDEPAAGRGDLSQVYAQAWGWVYYFLHSSVDNRLVFLDYLAKEKKPGGAKGTNKGAYLNVLKSHGIALKSLDSRFKSFFARLPVSGKVR